MIVLLMMLTCVYFIVILTERTGFYFPSLSPFLSLLNCHPCPLQYLCLVCFWSYQLKEAAMTSMNADDFLFLGVEGIIGKNVWSVKTAEDRFVGHFGTKPIIVAVLWRLLKPWARRLRGCMPYHLLWTLLFLKSYGTERQLAAFVGADEKTYRKWMWYMLKGLSRLTRRTVSVSQFKFVVCVCVCVWNDFLS